MNRPSSCRRGGSRTARTGGCHPHAASAVCSAQKTDPTGGSGVLGGENLGKSLSSLNRASFLSPCHYLVGPRLGWIQGDSDEFSGNEIGVHLISGCISSDTRDREYSAGAAGFIWRGQQPRRMNPAARACRQPSKNRATILDMHPGDRPARRPV